MSFPDESRGDTETRSSLIDNTSRETDVSRGESLVPKVTITKEKYHSLLSKSEVLEKVEQKLKKSQDNLVKERCKSTNLLHKLGVMESAQKDTRAKLEEERRRSADLVTKLGVAKSDLQETQTKLERYEYVRPLLLEPANDVVDSRADVPDSHAEDAIEDEWEVQNLAVIDDLLAQQD